jgi:hypothetical protein
MVQLRIMDLTMPTAPREVGVHLLKEPIQSITAAVRHAFIAVRGCGPRTLDVSE